MLYTVKGLREKVGGVSIRVRVISKEEPIIIKKPIKEKISVKQEIKKNWHGIGTNLKDGYREIKELTFSDFKNVIKNPFLAIKEAGKDLGKSFVSTDK